MPVEPLQNARSPFATGVLAVGGQEAFAATLWFGGLILVLATAVVILAYVRRRMRGSPSGDFQGFTLDDIRVMKARGELSETEYDALRRQILGLEGSPGTEGAGE